LILEQRFLLEVLKLMIDQSEPSEPFLIASSEQGEEEAKEKVE